MISIIEQPNYISPTGNPILFRVEDTNPDVVFFRALIYEVGTGKILGTLKVFKSPTEDGNFIDISSRLKNFVKTTINNSTSLFDSVGGAVQYYVIFQSVDSNGNVTPNGSVQTEYKWVINAGGDILNGYNYDETDWYMSVSQVGVKYADFLTSKPKISDIFVFQKEFLYFLADSFSGINKAVISVYDKNNVLIGNFQEPIDITPLDGILHRLYIQPNLLSTVYDFDVNKLHRIQVALYNDDIRVSELRTFLVDESYDCSVDKVNVLWENYEGGIDTYTFINPRETKNVNRQVMRMNGYANSINNVFENQSQVVSASVESTYRLTTLGLSDEIYKTLSNMIGTENAYVELGDGSLWGIVLSNNAVEVKKRKYENSLLRFNLQFNSIPNLDLINRGNILIEDDTTPSEIYFKNIIEANFNTQYTSNTVTINGINVTVPVSITGGQYRVNNGIWTNQPSILNNGDKLTLRVTTTNGSLADSVVTVNVGDGSSVWTVKNKQILNEPDTVSFTNVIFTELNTVQTSNLVTITGINVPISISVSNGSYSKNSGAYSNAPTTAVNGDTFVLRHQSAGVGLTDTTTVFNYGNKTSSFTTSTRVYDITPDTFTFNNVTDALTNNEYLSNIITVNGITEIVNISVTTGQYRINSGNWVSTSGTVKQGDTVQLRLISPANMGQSVNTTVTIGDKSASWNVDTKAPNVAPQPFNFTPNIGGANLDVYLESNVITVSGINVGSPISITSGGTYTQYRINGGSWTSANGTVFNGDTVQLRIKSSTLHLDIRTATLSIGGVTDSWSVSTVAMPVVEITMCGKITNTRVSLTSNVFANDASNVSFTQNIVLTGTIYYTSEISGAMTRDVVLTLNAGNTEQIFNNQTSAGAVSFEQFLVTDVKINGVSVNGTNVNTSAGTKQLSVEYSHYLLCQ